MACAGAPGYNGDLHVQPGRASQVTISSLLRQIFEIQTDRFTTNIEKEEEKNMKWFRLFCLECYFVISALLRLAA